MYRALLELIVTIVVLIAARALLTNFLRGMSNATKTFQNPPANTEPPPPSANNLHKDPVCGTFVAESTPYQRRSANQVFYYCSVDCREKHALVAR